MNLAFKDDENNKLNKNEDVKDNKPNFINPINPNTNKLKSTNYSKNASSLFFQVII